MTDNRTTELREKLTELGVKWWPMHNNGYYEDRDTEFVANGKKHTAHEWGDGLAVYNLTPDQAIAATLGSGTCHIVERNGDWYCDACGEMVGTCDPASELFIDGNAVELWNYCPSCGCKVVNVCDHS